MSRKRKRLALLASEAHGIAEQEDELLTHADPSSEDLEDGEAQDELDEDDDDDEEEEEDVGEELVEELQHLELEDRVATATPQSQQAALATSTPTAPVADPRPPAVRGGGRRHGKVAIDFSTYFEMYEAQLRAPGSSERPQYALFGRVEEQKEPHAMQIATLVKVLTLRSVQVPSNLSALLREGGTFVALALPAATEPEEVPAPPRSAAELSATAKEDPDSVALMLLWITRPKVGVAQTRRITELLLPWARSAERRATLQVLVVSHGHITPYAKRELLALSVGFAHFDHLFMYEITRMATEHILVNKHTAVPATTLAKLRCTKENMALLGRNDIVTRLHGWPVDTIVHIKRRYGGASPASSEYRIVALVPDP